MFVKITLPIFTLSNSEAIKPAEKSIKMTTAKSTITYFEPMNRHQIELPKFDTGKHWFFNNGQYAQKTQILAWHVLSLSYCYGRVYVMWHTLNNCGGTEHLGSSTCVSSKKEWQYEISQLFEADSAIGIVPSGTEIKF